MQDDSLGFSRKLFSWHGSTRICEFSLTEGALPGFSAPCLPLRPARPGHRAGPERWPLVSSQADPAPVGEPFAPPFLLPPRLSAERGSRPSRTPPPSLLPGLKHLSAVTGKFQSRRDGGREPCRAGLGERGLPWAPLLPPSTPGALGGRAGSRADLSRLCPASCSATFFTLRRSARSREAPGGRALDGSPACGRGRATSAATSTRNRVPGHRGGR